MNIDVVDPKGKKSSMEVIALKIKEVDITVGYMGHTTVAVARINGTEGLGMAICMKGDKYSKDIGTGLAAARAIRHIADTMEEVWNKRSITKDEWKENHKKG